MKVVHLQWSLACSVNNSTEHFVTSVSGTV